MDSIIEKVEAETCLAFNEFSSDAMKTIDYIDSSIDSIKSDIDSGIDSIKSDIDSGLDSIKSDIDSGLDVIGGLVDPSPVT